MLNPEEQWPLNLTITAIGATVSIAGHITNIMEVQGIDLKLAVKGPDIANFQQVTGEPLPLRVRLTSPAISPPRPLKTLKSLISRFYWVKAESAAKLHSIRHHPDPKSMPNFTPQNWTCDRS